MTTDITPIASVSRRLRDAFDDFRCRIVIRRHSKTFHKAFSAIADPEKRNAVYAVYAFCRYADDIVDTDGNAHALDTLERELASFRDGRTPERFRWRALRRAADRFYPKGYDFRPFFDMIEGQRRELDHRNYRTFDELLSYCRLVAGTVGLMLVPILADNHDDRHEHFAVDLGHAMQLTNILRDVGEDARNGKTYLPLDLMNLHGYTVKDLRSGRINEAFIALFEDIAGRAENLFARVLKKTAIFSSDARFPIAASIILYRGIIDACRKNGYDVFTKKNFVPKSEKYRLIGEYLASAGK